MRVMISWQSESSFFSGPLGITGGYCEADSTLCVELISKKFQSLKPRAGSSYQEPTSLRTPSYDHHLETGKRNAQSGG